MTILRLGDFKRFWVSLTKRNGANTSQNAATPIKAYRLTTST